MKQLLRKALLVLLGGVFMSTAAWADTTIVGDVTDEGYYTNDHCARYSLEPNKTISIEFTVTANSTLSSTDWKPWFAWAVNFWDGTLNAITVEARNYGWEDKTANNRWTANWAKYWAINYPDKWETDDNFRGIIQGATVVATVKRIGADVVIIYDITTTDGKKYRQYAVKEYGDGTKTLWFDLIVNHTQITIDNDKTKTTSTETIQGTLHGVENNTGGFAGGEHTDITLPAGKALKLHFKNYSNGVQAWYNWILEIQKDSKYLDLRADNHGWSTADYYNESNISLENYPSWDVFRTYMDGADVDMTISRETANTIAIEAKQTLTNGTVAIERYTITHDDFASGDATVRLLTEGAHLDLLSTNTESYQTINAYGWATYSSDKALDFSTPIDGLTVYAVTDHTESTLTLAPITTAVPANTGLLLKGTAGTCYTIPVAASGTAPAGNLLKAGTGASVAPESGKTKYALSVNAGVASFKKIAAAREIPAGKAYLEFNETIAAREFFALDESEVTGISSIENGKMTIDNAWYSLDGRKYNGKPSVKGVYVNNGRKVVLK